MLGCKRVSRQDFSGEIHIQIQKVLYFILTNHLDLNNWPKQASMFCMHLSVFFSGSHVNKASPILLSTQMASLLQCQYSVFQEYLFFENEERAEEQKRMNSLLRCLGFSGLCFCSVVAIFFSLSSAETNVAPARLHLFHTLSSPTSPL